MIAVGYRPHKKGRPGGGLFHSSVKYRISTFRSRHHTAGRETTDQQQHQAHDDQTPAAHGRDDQRTARTTHGEVESCFPSRLFTTGHKFTTGSSAAHVSREARNVRRRALEACLFILASRKRECNRIRRKREHSVGSVESATDIDRLAQRVIGEADRAFRRLRSRRNRAEVQRAAIVGIGRQRLTSAFAAQRIGETAAGLVRVVSQDRQRTVDRANAFRRAGDFDVVGAVERALAGKLG